MYRDWEDNLPRLSFEFFQNLPKRLRRYIQRVERKCYSVHYAQTISLFDWTVFMNFVARECPNLHSLKLWGPGDRNEAPGWLESCQKDAEWIQAILQIKSLRYFDIPVIRGGIIYHHAAFRDDFLPWLQTSLIENQKTTADMGQTPVTDDHSSGQLPKKTVLGQIPAADDGTGGHFPFLRLNRKVRDLIYREVLLPHNKRLHPYVNPAWYDQTTCNIIPLFLTCKHIHEEAEALLYEEAVFCSPIPKYDDALNTFVKENSARVPKTITYQRSYDGTRSNRYALMQHDNGRITDYSSD